MIKVTEKYWIDVDNCYIVQEKKVAASGKNKGEVLYSNPTYHGTMNEALVNVIRRIQRDKLKENEVIELKDAINILTDIQKEFTDIAKGLESIGGKENV